MVAVLGGNRTRMLVSGWTPGAGGASGLEVSIRSPSGVEPVRQSAIPHLRHHFAIVCDSCRHVLSTLPGAPSPPLYPACPLR